ncbi:hypothetical protein QAO71_04940 [Halopseudomonas sp. SMJS2]|uniref:hypothetical protein n=1 Tax=Halopseudomonas sp. SMJS2 TaxID=3041098 RepID=UPI0024531D2B|nr:hypothetical protein [Halopseudomonas sp. SMJS2]WGK62588.1 hypothetical protein QAO71_04940 [Halopseudomonas sp. SMJS2]
MPRYLRLARRPTGTQKTIIPAYIGHGAPILNDKLQRLLPLIASAFSAKPSFAGFALYNACNNEKRFEP